MNPILQINISKHCAVEKRYIIDWVLGEVLGLKYIIEESEIQSSTEIIRGNKILSICSFLFDKLDSSWGSEIILEDLNWKTDNINILGTFESISIFTPKDRQRRDSNIHIPYDILGSIFWFLSRYEEILTDDNDKHDRFKLTNALNGQNGMIMRPFVNEYIDILWKCISRLWPDLIRKNREFTIYPSHDIDHPSFYWHKGLVDIFKSCAKDLIVFKNAVKATEKFINWMKYSLALPSNDVYDNCDWIMDQSEKRGLISSFYYIPIQTHAFDPFMPLEHRIVQNQLKSILKRGHIIGYHPGYESYQSKQVMNEGLAKLKSTLKSIEPNAKIIGGRQHVLRYRTSITERILDDLGHVYDSTLGYAEHIGFRCGTCYEYPMYDLINRKKLRIRQRPLLLMDVSLISNRYMSLNYEDAYNEASKIVFECKKYNGDFTILWHNSELDTNEKTDLYLSILDA